MINWRGRYSTPNITQSQSPTALQIIPPRIIYKNLRPQDVHNHRKTAWQEGDGYTREEYTFDAPIVVSKRLILEAQRLSKPGSKGGRRLESLETKISKLQIWNQTYTVFVDKGNNHEIVRKILQKRPWLIEQLSSCNVNFRWKPTSKDLAYGNLSLNPNGKRVVFNHLEFHKEITTKQRLYFNLKHYCQKYRVNMDAFIPKTYILNVDGQNFQQELQEFIDEFLRHKQTKESKNFWIVKPPDLNRGQGIQIVNELRYFMQHLLECCKVKPNFTSQKTVLKNVIVQYPGEKYDINKDQSGMTTFNFFVEQDSGSNKRQIVIQKYLENPYLYKSRKFDFRVWVLVDHQLQYYFFREGYLRLSSENFDLSNYSVRNLYVHLTNNAIQKNHSQYQKFELGNQLSFSDLQNYLHSQGVDLSVRDKIIPRMKEIIQLTFQCALERFLMCTRKFQFEIFGYDFMIDSDGNLWLIEVNTNPCIEESSPLLQKLIPRMLNDAFRLTIDKILSPLKGNDMDRQLPEKFYDFLDQYSVPGYSNSEILWDYVGKII